MKTYTIKSKYGIFNVLLDDDDYDKIIKNNIMLTLHCAKRYKTPYVKFNVRKANGKRTTKLLHRYIMGESSLQVDHINRNPLDNRKANLRFCTNFENSQNKSDKDTGLPIGVGFHKYSNKYRAYINDGNKQISLGYYDKKEDAINAREMYMKNTPW